VCLFLCMCMGVCEREQEQERKKDREIIQVYGLNLVSLLLLRHFLHHRKCSFEL
jgi:hypothetical protein